jgi:integrase
MEPKGEQEVSPPAAMMNLITGYWVSQAVGVIARWGVADQLGAHPRGSDELARAVGGKKRRVPLSSGAFAALRAHARAFPSAEVTLPWSEADGKPVTVQLLVTADGGRMYTGDLFSKVVWQGAFRTAGLEYRTRADGMHALRHFYASTLLAQGVSIKELAEYLGHGDPGFTLRTYTHLVPYSYERARMAIDGVFGPKSADGLDAA